MQENITREKNRAIVWKYMHTFGEARLSRHQLFTKDGVSGLWTSDTGTPVSTHGKDRLREHAAWSLKCFPDWQWFNIKLFDTQNPNIFWVECDGKGLIRFDGYPEGIYENHFIHYFEFENGLIKLQREFMNPCMQFKALGIEIPKIVRNGIPT